MVGSSDQLGVRVERVRGTGQGTARIFIPGLSCGPEAQFIIRRFDHPDGDNLSLHGWRSSATTLIPLHVEQTDAGAWLYLDADVTNWIESGTSIEFFFPDYKIRCVVNWPDIPYRELRTKWRTKVSGSRFQPEPADLTRKQSASATATAPAASLLSAQEPLDASISTPPATEVVATALSSPTDLPPLAITPPEPTPNPALTGIVAARTAVTLPAGWIALAILLFVSAVAGGTGWWLLSFETPAQVTTPAPEPAQPPSVTAAAPPAAPAADVQAPPSSTPPNARTLAELALLPVDEVGELARKAQADDRHDDALLLFEAAAGRGHGPSHTAIGRLYDPNGFVPGKPFSKPNRGKAVERYRAALESGDASAQASYDALVDRLRLEARTDDDVSVEARTILRQLNLL